MQAGHRGVPQLDYLLIYLSIILIKYAIFILLLIIRNDKITRHISGATTRRSAPAIFSARLRCSASTIEILRQSFSVS